MRITLGFNILPFLPFISRKEGQPVGKYDEVGILRDMQIAQEIRDMAALGVFPKEITAYGLVYYQRGQRQYMISTDPTKLISFLNEVENQVLFPTPMECYSERLIIPEGYEEDIVIGIKLKLVKNLQQLYPLQLFERLDQLSNKTCNNVMAEPLQQYRLELESEFHTEKIRAFLALCTKVYLRKNISELVAQQLTNWCEKRLRELEAFIPPTNEKEKTFYGLAVLRDYKIDHCIINANLLCIEQEKCRLEQQEAQLTSWHKKVFIIERQESLRSIQQQMVTFLQTIYDEKMIDLMKKADHTPSVITKAEMQKVLNQLSEYGVKAEALGRHYGQMWGALTNESKRDGDSDEGSC